MYKIAKSEIGALLAKVAGQMDLFVPASVAGQTNFALWTEETVVDLDTLKTVKSPKDVFFPQSENLYSVNRVDKKYKITPEERCNEDFVVFGMKGCDVQGIKVLDKVFLADPVDSYYAARRAHGTIVAMACAEPEESCFCKVFGIDAADPDADVAIWSVGDDYLWKALISLRGLMTALLTRQRMQSERSLKSSPTATSASRAGTAQRLLRSSTLQFGKKFISPAWLAVHAHSCAPHASATTSRTTTQETAFSVTAAGTPVCTPTSQ